MNAKALTILAVLAVAAVAVVGAGYAYYWGQTQVTDNQVDVEYLAVQTDMDAINETVEFNTTYVKGTGYTISTTPALETIDASGKNLANCYTLAKEIPFTIKAPTQLTDFDFQVTLETVDLGSNAKLWFGYGASDETAVFQNKLVEFKPIGEITKNVPTTYVAVVPYDSINFALAADSASGYSVTLKAYFYLQEAQLTVADVNIAKCNIGTATADDGKLTYQVAIDKVTATEDTTTKGLWIFDDGDGDETADIGAWDSITVFDKGEFQTAVFGTEGNVNKLTLTASDNNNHDIILKLTGSDGKIIYKIMSLKVSSA